MMLFNKIGLNTFYFSLLKKANEIIEYKELNEDIL